MASAESLWNACEGSPISFLHDLTLAGQVLSPRDAKIRSLRWGLQTGKAETLEDVGNALGITRERVRQLARRVDQWCLSVRPRLAILEITLAGLDQLALPTPEAWYAILPATLRPSTPDAFSVLHHTSSVGWTPQLTRGAYGLFFKAESRDEASVDALTIQLRAASKVIRHSIRRVGAVNLRPLEEMLGENAVPSVLAVIPSLKMAKVVEGWMIPTKRTRSILQRQVDRIAFVVSTVPLERLRRRLGRSIRKGTVLPRGVLRLLLQKDCAAQIDDHDVVSLYNTRELLRNRNPLTKADKTAASIFSANAAVTMDDFRSAFIGCGYSAGMAGVVATYSPIVERAAAGVFTLTGSEIPAEQIRRLRRKAMESARKALLGYRNLSGGRLELRYRMDPASTDFTFFSVPVGRIPIGDWKMEKPFEHTIRVRRTYLTGIHRVARHVTKSGIHTLCLVFDFDTRVVNAAAP